MGLGLTELLFEPVGGRTDHKCGAECGGRERGNGPYKIHKIGHVFVFFFELRLGIMGTPGPFVPYARDE